MTIHHDWDKAEAARLPALKMPKMAWFMGEDSDAKADAMPFSKRAFDVCLACFLLIPLSLVMLVVALVLLIVQGRPVFYAAPRMRTPGQSFTHLKFRTMLRQDGDSGVTGGHKKWRITPLGRFLRRTRIDELPQLFNILRGDMSFVGPRPTIHEYVERFPAVYAQVLNSRPGVTGLATLIYHRHEDKILAKCISAEATEKAYASRCLPTKLRIDLIYQRNRSFFLDMWIMWQTVLIVVVRDEKIKRHWRFKKNRP